MSYDEDHGDMEEVGHSSADFFDRDPSKQEKIEVCQFGHGTTQRASDGTLLSAIFPLQRLLLANIPLAPEMP